MGLFTNPVVLDDGIVATRSHVFRGQLMDSKSVIGQWIEPAASFDADSTITVKHAVSGLVHRSLISGKENVIMPDAITMKPVTTNFTVIYSTGTAEAQLQKRVNLIIDALQQADFVKNLMNGLI